MTLVCICSLLLLLFLMYALGYIAQFIFETAKVSQLFCHQIIWNMKANCYKDDAAEIVSSMHVFVSAPLTRE
jgi:hypothetical protein